ncbi:hypothetical protein [Erythrobacter sp. KY5]|uniref:hypothetical protein n=1 Tax=Erythrobacter sp. KY5 TaxID=2011159 RepID=UPI0013A6E274|nr:hypothetical protein [Erythrobacter sp. KY5]
MSQITESEPKKRRKASPSKRPFTGIAAHRAFVPIVTIWAAALLGLIMVVLPQPMIDKLGALSGGLVAGLVARIVLAAAAASIGGVLGYGISSALHRKFRRTASARGVYSAYHASRLPVIDPVTDLGSVSLDAPLEDETEDGSELASSEPLGELSRRGYEMEASEEDAPKASALFTHGQYKQALIECCEGASCEASPSDDTAQTPPAALPDNAAPDNAALASRPRELDLAEFAELPGRNAVWVEEVGDQPQAPKPQLKPKSVPASALEKLRERPTEELSLVEMVERFAGALHQHQESERGRHSGHTPGRDAALAEALKALTLFTQDGFDTPASAATATRPGDRLGQTERDLRDALAKLQTLRGAA